jgi:hypothetical protein
MKNVLGIGVVAGYALALCVAVSAQAPVAIGVSAPGQFKEPADSDWEYLLPDGEGRDQVAGTCQACHSLKNIVISRRDEADWRSVLDMMVANGAMIEVDQLDPIVKYLVGHFGAGRPPLELPIALNTAPPERLALLPLSKEEVTQMTAARAKKPFTDVGELKGIVTEEKLAKLKPFVVVE